MSDTTLYKWGDDVLDENALGVRTMEAFVEIESIVDDIVALAYDGCHKIYLALDQQEAESLRLLGYADDGHTSEFLWAGQMDIVSILDTVQHWYYKSCGLVFISTVKGGNFKDIIPQIFTTD